MSGEVLPWPLLREPLDGMEVREDNSDEAWREWDAAAGLDLDLSEDRNRSGPT